jgi:hypothetical protein
VSVLDGPGEGTWSVFALKVVEQRDAAREEAARFRRRYEEARDAIRLVLEADALREHAYDCGDDDFSIYDLCKKVLRENDEG